MLYFPLRHLLCSLAAAVVMFLLLLQNDLCLHRQFWDISLTGLPGPFLAA